MNNNQFNQQMPNQNMQQMPQQGGIICPACGSNNVSVQMVQDNMRTSTKGNGCLWGLGRMLLICCTCGLWLLVGKHKATSTTTVSSRKVHVCQNCGNTW